MKSARQSSRLGLCVVLATLQLATGCVFGGVARSRTTTPAGGDVANDKAESASLPEGEVSTGEAGFDLNGASLQAQLRHGAPAAALRMMSENEAGAADILTPASGSGKMLLSMLGIILLVGGLTAAGAYAAGG